MSRAEVRGSAETSLAPVRACSDAASVETRLPPVMSACCRSCSCRGSTPSCGGCFDGPTTTRPTPADVPTPRRRPSTPTGEIVDKTSHYIDKLRGSVATYWRRGGVANNQIRKGLLLSLSKLQAITWMSRTLSSSVSSVLASRANCMRQPRSCL